MIELFGRCFAAVAGTGLGLVVVLALAAAVLGWLKNADKTP